MTHKEIMDRYHKLINNIMEAVPDSLFQQSQKEELDRLIAFLAAKAAE